MQHVLDLLHKANEVVKEHGRSPAARAEVRPGGARLCLQRRCRGRATLAPLRRHSSRGIRRGHVLGSPNRDWFSSFSLANPLRLTPDGRRHRDVHEQSGLLTNRKWA